MKFYGIGRTSKVQELKVTKNDDGSESKSITFTIASNRNYSVNKTVNGQIVSERPTDFLFCMAYGKTAEIISEYCNVHGEDGKLISRHLQVNGELRTYRKNEVRYTKIVIDGAEKTLKFEVPIEHTVLMVNEIEFLDSMNSNKPKVTTKAPEGADIIDGGVVSTSPDTVPEKTETETTTKEEGTSIEGDVNQIPSDEELDSVLDQNEPF